MKREQLEHLIRAAGDIADDDELIILGSQAVLGQFPTASGGLTLSMEADIYPRSKPDRADLIDGSIGEGSPFHETYGYYAQGVDRSTAILPCGWEDRLVPIQNANTHGICGYCLEIHDLVISKCVAGRAKDWRFYAEAVQAGLIDHETLLDRLAATVLDEQRQDAIRDRFAAGSRAPQKS